MEGWPLWSMMIALRLLCVVSCGINIYFEVVNIKWAPIIGHGRRCRVGANNGVTGPGVGIKVAGSNDEIDWV